MLYEGDTYIGDMIRQRAAREKSLRGEQGWLTLAGLFWLQEGDNAFGSDPANDIILPSHSAPLHAGFFRLEGQHTLLRVDPDATMTVNGRPVTTMVLNDDMSGSPDYVRLGNLIIGLLDRRGRYAIRLWDTTRLAEQTFAALQWYALDPAYCVRACFVPYETPRMLNIVDVTNGAYAVSSPGYVVFEWEGETHCLEAERRDDKLFFNFRDLTNGDTTYGAGRFLYAPLPQDGEVILDFNQATNPFCAYTLHATCPLPPRRNHLPIRVEAGERTYPSPVPEKQLLVMA